MKSWRVSVAGFLMLQGLLWSAEGYSCGEKKQVNREYGKVELRVDCETTPGRMWVAEFDGEHAHGMSMGFDRKTHRKQDSCFYVNDLEEGTCLVWDSVGGVIGRSIYKRGRFVGKREVYFSPNHPSLVKTYNQSGKEDGPWNVWWPNGNKKSDFLAKDGEIIQATEYYPDGKMRVRYRVKPDPANTNALKVRYQEGEAWAPNGKSTGKIAGGNGTWVLFPDGQESKDTKIVQETYKDGLLIKVAKLDSAQVSAWTY